MGLSASIASERQQSNPSHVVQIMNTSSCKACSGSDLRIFQAKEMMHGLRHEFNYGQCKGCGSIQILQVPDNLSDYYPGNYYSLQTPLSSQRTLRQWLLEQRLEYCQGKSNFLGGFLRLFFGAPLIVPTDWMSLVGVRTEDRVLDVGCGSGQLLASMAAMGFKHLTGVDPNLASDIQGSGFKLIKKDLCELDDKFDFIMLHHSFEHMENPLQALRDIHRLLDEEGLVLVRTPIANSYASRHYGANWYQLDAPRHLFIPSVKGLNDLAETTGFLVESVFFDSSYVQFTLSEKYGRYIPLGEPDTKTYGKHELRALAHKAIELNEVLDGDQAGFILRKKCTKPSLI